MAIRKAHGKGAAALVRSETRPIDELPAINADDTSAGLASTNARGRPFERGNKAARGRKPALASVGGMPTKATDPRYQTALGWSRRYRAQRVRELTIQHGGRLSSGVCAILTSAALDFASARYLTALGAETGDTAIIKMASHLATAARQHELTAMDLASREAEAWRESVGTVDPLADLAFLTGDEPEE